MWSLVTKRKASAALALLLVARVAVSCTVFDGLVPPDPGPAPDGGAAAGAGGDRPDAGTGGASSGGGGAAGGGGEVAPEDAYLTLKQAATLCARVFGCTKPVGPSIRASIGVPVDGQGGDPPPTFSHCVHWLAGPLPSTRPIAGQQNMLKAMAAAKDCDSTLAEAYVEKLLDAMDPRCEGKTERNCSNDASEVIDCTAPLQVERCKTGLLGVSTSCIEAPGVVACATQAQTCAVPMVVCNGDALAYCPSLYNLWQMAGCAERGLACSTNVVPTNCAYNDGAQGCNTLAETGCDGEVARVCADGIGTTGIQLWSPFDCAAIDGGASCADSVASGGSGPAAVRCELARAKCSPEGADSCQGTAIKLCVRGEHTLFECKDIGMGCGGSPPRCQL